MKKVAAGFLAGVLAAMTATAYADDIQSVVGRAVEGTLPLKIDGNRAAKDVIVLDGTSYLPVRTAGELFGYRVDYVNGEVLLDKQTGSVPAADSGTDGTGEDAAAEEVVIGVFSVKTALFALNSAKGTLVERAGEQFLSVLVFESYLSNDGTTVRVSLPGRSPVEFDYKGAYKSGVNGYNENGLYVSLQALGLKAVTNGSALTLVQRK